VVANLVGQAELIAAAATLLACLLHLGRPEGTDVDWGRRVAYVTLFLTAVLAKENAIAMPVLLVVLDIAQRRVVLTRASFLRYARSLIMVVFLLGATTVAYLALRVSVIGSITGVDAGPGLPYLREGYRMITAFRAWPEFARLLFFPVDLAVDYSPGVVLPTTGMTPMAGLGILLLFGTTACAAVIFHAPLTGLAGAWFLVTVLMVSNLLFPIGVLMAERTLYTPSMALSFAVGGLIVAARTLSPGRRRAGVAALCMVITLLAARTWIRNPDWASTEAVGAALARDWPEAYRTHWLRADQYTADGRMQEAELAWRTAHRIWPRDAALLAGFGEFLMTLRRFEEAVPLLEEAEQLTPWAGHMPALLARAYLGVGRFQDAIDASGRAFRGKAIEPARYFGIRARAYEGLGDAGNAIAAWRVAARQPPGDEWIYPAMLARALARYGLEEDAAAAAAAAVMRADQRDEERGMEVARAVRDAITHGCYRSIHVRPAPAGGTLENGCGDPLASWSLFGEPTFVQPAKVSQSAT
jgi:protein O-mannosyl-transferase